jgi:hypothetical protein
MPGPRRVEEAVEETDTQQGHDRRRVACPERAQRPAHAALRRALTLHRPGKDHPIPARPPEKRSQTERDHHGQGDQGAHENTSLSAKYAPTGGKLSSAAIKPPMEAISASNMA